MFEVDIKRVKEFDYSHFSPITIEKLCSGIVTLGCDEANECKLRKYVENGNDVLCKFYFTYNSEERAFAALKSIRTLLKSTMECDYNTFYFYDKLYCYSLLLSNETVIFKIYANIDLAVIMSNLYNQEEK